jgi:adenine-specific DNA-methyltransferase
MARLEDLIANVEDAALRDALAREVKVLKQKTRFGLVFERHLPENVLLPGAAGLDIGDLVRLRDHPQDRRELRVLRRANGRVVFVDEAGVDTEADDDDLLVVKGFGETVYPTLTPVSEVGHGGDRPWHAAINGENYHALQVLLHCMAGQVDCIYADPPYNTGARDWKYNNDYVDRNDTWRHSKWLSMMEKRLRLAKRLLKPDGVLIVTIDENEVHHLGVLMETMFPDALRQMVTICIQPSGASGGDGLSRVEEYAFFCFLGGTQPTPTLDDMLVEEGADGTETEQHGIRWERLMRGGNAWYRASRPNLCYPVLLNEDRTQIVRALEHSYTGPVGERPTQIDGHPVALPVRTDGKLGIWRVEAARLNWLHERGYAQVTSPPRKDNPTLRYLLGGTVDKIEEGVIKVIGRGERGQVLVQAGGTGARRAKTMWYRGRHTAGGGGGTQLLNALLGERNVFPFPKSVYAVRDCLDVAVGSRRDALIVDFFAGSGTTMHATCLLNAEDGGRRRSVLVTNNEVTEERARRLRKEGHRPGDAAWERHGIFEAATRPRCEAAITGKRPDGTDVAGKYLDGSLYAEGFKENVEFYRLDYLHPDEVELGRAFQAVHPLLWLMAGGRGNRPDELTPDQSFAVVAEGGYAVLFDDRALREFIAALNGVESVTHLFLVTNSEDAYAEMAEAVGAGYTTRMLYRDYLRSFRIQAGAV